MKWWKGRQPALFSDKNVTVSDGKLHLTMRKEKLPPEAEKLGYHDYTSAALHTKARSSYGYYEVKAKPMNSGGSSSFWFQQGGHARLGHRDRRVRDRRQGQGLRAEVQHDPARLRRRPSEKKHWQRGRRPGSPPGGWPTITTSTASIGARTRSSSTSTACWSASVENTHWHQPLYLIFDSETMPEWFGMPDDKDLPSTFSVEYVRAWKAAE